MPRAATHFILRLLLFSFVLPLSCLSDRPQPPNPKMNSPIGPPPTCFEYETPPSSRPPPTMGQLSAGSSIPWHKDLVLVSDLSPDGSAIATAGRDGSLRIWRIADGSLLKELRFGGVYVRELSWSNASSLLIVIQDNTGIEIYTWNYRSRLLPQEIARRPLVGPAFHRAAQFSPSGHWLCIPTRCVSPTGAPSSFEFRIFDITQKEPMSAIAVPHDFVWGSYAWSPNSKQLAINSGGLLSVWQARSGRRQWAIARRKEYEYANVFWLRGGTRIGLSTDRRLQIRGAATGVLLKERVLGEGYRKYYHRSWFVDTPAKTIAYLTYYCRRDRCHFDVELLDKDSLATLSRITRPVPGSGIPLYDFSPDGARLAVQTDSGITALKLKNGAARHVASTGVAKKLLFLSDERLAAVYPDATAWLRIWAVSSGKAVAQYRCSPDTRAPLKHVIWNKAKNVVGLMLRTHIVAWDFRKNAVTWREQRAGKPGAQGHVVIMEPVTGKEGATSYTPVALDVETGRRIGPAAPSEAWYAPKHPAVRSPDGGLIARVEDVMVLMDRGQPEGACLAGYHGSCVSFNEMVPSRIKHIKVSDPRKGTPVAQCAVPYDPMRLQWSSDSKLLSVISPTVMTVFDTRAKKVVRTVRSKFRVFGMPTSSAGLGIGVCDGEDGAKVRHLSTHEVIWSAPPPCKEVGWLKNGHIMWVLEDDGLRLVRIKDGASARLELYVTQNGVLEGRITGANGTTYPALFHDLLAGKKLR